MKEVKKVDSKTILNNIKNGLAYRIGHEYIMIYHMTNKGESTLYAFFWDFSPKEMKKLEKEVVCLNKN